MKTETFKKVYINSESDLPKDGLYFCAITDDCYGSFHFNPDDKDDIDFWTGNVMWYLLPEQTESTEEIRKELDAAWLKGFETGKYASQPSEVSDDDIEKESQNVIMNYLTHNNFGGDFKETTIGADDKRLWWCFGAKAMRDGQIPKK